MTEEKKAGDFAREISEFFGIFFLH